jgi:hypothetical protein
MLKSPSRLLTAIALLTAIGCGDDGGSEPDGTIAVSASPSTLTLPQGGTGTVTVTLVRGGGFDDPVNVAVSGLPSGVTATASPAQLTGATTSTTVTVNVANTVAAGTYTATITASAAGVGNATTTYSLTVTALPTFALSANPAAVSIGQGGSSTTTINVNRTNFTSPVALSLQNPPAGITGSFNPLPATGDQSTLTLNVAGTVATGNVTLTVLGTASGQPDKTTTVTLTVTPPPDYTLSVTPTSVPVNAGSTGQVTVNIARTNFTGTVNLALDAPPAGITATFNPAATTGNSSVATISAAASVAPGNYNVTIKGTATGVPTNVVPSNEAAAAGDRTVTVQVVVSPAPNFTISAAPNALNATPGGAAVNSTITIARTNLTSDVALSLVSPPTGITGVFTPATLTGANLTSTLALTVAGTVAPGNHTLTVQGVGGALTKTATIALTVATGPSVTFSMTPATLSLEQGGAGQATLNVARSNFTGNVTPTVTGAPNGMTVNVTPNPITGNTATVAVSVGASVATGNHTLTITGNTGGAAGSPSTTLTVTVSQATGQNNAWEFCSNEVPVKFWRLTNGTWSEVTGTVVGNVTRFSFTTASGSNGVAFTVSASGRFTTFVYLAQNTELSGLARSCATAAGTVSKTFNVSGMGGAETGTLGYGGASATLSSATASYNLNVVPGTYDWFAAFGAQPGLPDFSYNWTNYRIGRGEAAPGGAVAVNRTGAPAFVTAPWTVTGAAGGSTNIVSQSLQTANGTALGFPLGSVIGGATSGNMLFLQPADRLASDLWLLNVSNAEIAGAVTDVRAIQQYVGSAPPAGITLALPAKVPVFTTSTVATSPTRWQVVGSIPTDYQTAVSSVSASYTGQGSNQLYTITATRAWLVANGMSTNYTLINPDLPGFLTQWAPSAPLLATSVIMVGSNATAAPTAGTITVIGTRVVQ